MYGVLIRIVAFVALVTIAVVKVQYIVHFGSGNGIIVMTRPESTVQNLTRELHPRVTNGQIWRNNSGAYQDEFGRMVRYGLCNDSAQLNAVIKSSDLIGITPTLITPAMVGYYLGVFTAYECKPEGWKLTPGDKRGLAQAKFHDIVKQACGFAGFVSDPQDIYGIIGRG